MNLTDKQVEWIKNEIMFHFLKHKPIETTRHCSFDVDTKVGKVKITFDAVSIFGYKILTHAYVYFFDEGKGVHIDMTLKQSNSIARTIYAWFCDKSLTECNKKTLLSGLSKPNQ